jgi:hypothetical protein
MFLHIFKVHDEYKDLVSFQHNVFHGFKCLSLGSVCACLHVYLFVSQALCLCVCIIMNVPVYVCMQLGAWSLY